MKQKIVLFEPWGLGDLAISLGLARKAAEQGLSTTLLCDPKFVAWAKTFSFLTDVRGITVPWTRKKEKYSFTSYPWLQWIELRRAFRHENLKFVIEPRHDPRASLLLKFLFSAPKKRPSSRAGGIGYRRLEILSTEKSAFKPTGKTPSIICFFGAEWPNRRVPEWKIPALLDVLRETGYPVSIIVPVEECENPFYGALSAKGFEIIKGSIEEVAGRFTSYSHCISTDSGWLHVAQLYGLKTMGMFGFDTINEWSPPQSAFIKSEHYLPASARYDKSCENIQPLGTLKVDLFAKVFQEFLRS